jgi:hypothetical protein
MAIEMAPEMTTDAAYGATPEEKHAHLLAPPSTTLQT